MPQNNSLSKTTLVLAAGENLNFLTAKLNQVLSNGGPVPVKILVVCPPGQKAKTLSKLSPFLKRVELVEIHSFRHDLPALVATPFLAYLPPNAPYSPPPLEGLGTREKTFFLRPWIPPVTLGPNEWARLVYMDFGWISTPAIFQYLGREESSTLRDMERVARRAQVHIPYLSTPARAPLGEGMAAPKIQSKLSADSRVCALVPHFKCEEWLEQCLDSLAGQTLPLDAILVLDDASQDPPVDIVRKFKQVTLLRSPENVGPYRLVQSAIEQTGFDAYMFQDADDWSSQDRLEKQLQEAARTGAEWIGSHELIYFDDVIHAARYPLILNPGLQATIRNFFSHPSSLVSRDLITRLGGFASGLRFSGDFEFLSRAVWAGKAVNLDAYAYFRRIRKNSLITSEETGLASPARKEVDTQIQKRVMENRDRASQGLPPMLEPSRKAGLVIFEHLAGPNLPLNIHPKR